MLRIRDDHLIPLSTFEPEYDKTIFVEFPHIENDWQNIIIYFIKLLFN